MIYEIIGIFSFTCASKVNGFKYHGLIMDKPRGGNYHWIDNHMVRATRYEGKFTDLVEKNIKIQVFK